MNFIFKFKTTNILKFLILFFLINFNANSQSTNLKKYFSNTSKYYKEKNYTKASKSADMAIELSLIEFGANHQVTATLLENKGRIYTMINKHFEAEKLFSKVASIRKKILDERDPIYAESLDHLARSIRSQGRLEEAIEIHDKVLSIMTYAIANNPHAINNITRQASLYRARAMHTKAYLLTKRKNYRDAYGLYKSATVIYERALGKNKHELIELLENYKDTLLINNKDEEAKNIVNKIKKIQSF